MEKQELTFYHMSCAALSVPKLQYDTHVLGLCSYLFFREAYHIRYISDFTDHPIGSDRTSKVTISPTIEAFLWLTSSHSVPETYHFPMAQTACAFSYFVP